MAVTEVISTKSAFDEMRVILQMKDLDQLMLWLFITENDNEVLARVRDQRRYFDE